MVYGPGQQDLSKLVPYVTLSLLRREVPKLTSGERQVDWIYVDDVVEGLIAMANAGKIDGRTFDFGSGVLTSIKSVVYKISEIVKSGVEPLFGSIAERPMEQVKVADVERTNSYVGWKPQTPLEKGLKYTVDWYKNAYIEI
jgi:nucleoside-diphosphate-sugar epimerase